MFRFPRMQTAAAVVVLMLIISTTAEAQAPSISATKPQAIRPGETLDVTLSGANLAGASHLWTSFFATAVLSPDVKDNGKQAGSVVYRLTVPADQQVGVHAIRVATPGGASKLRLFCVDDLPSVAQQANNTSPENAQALELPIAVDGSVASLGRNYYKFQAAAGQRIAFEVLARRLGSPLDPMIRILDSNGRELTYSDDEPGLSSDSQLSYTFGTAGEYVIEVRDISYRGGGNFNYRLRIGDFPCISVPYPMGVQRGSSVQLTFAGSDVQGIEPVALEVSTDPLVKWITIGGKLAGGKSSGMATLAVSDRPEFVETEPNNEAAAATKVSLDGNFNGRFDEPGDVDRFAFPAKKGQAYEFAALTRRQGASSDLVLRLLKPDGAQVAEVDDTGPNDGLIRYTFPEDGEYTLLVADRARRGGSRFVYRIVIQPNQPGFSLAASADTLNIPAGGTQLITVTSVRNGYNGPIQLSLADAPAGIAAVPTVIGPGRNSVVLTATAAADAAAGTSSPLKVVGKAKVGANDFQAEAVISDALKAQFNGIPFTPRVLESSGALGVGPKPAFTVRAEPKQVVFGKDLSTTVKLIIERPEGIDEAVSFKISPEKDGVPAGITAAVKPIAKGAKEIAITVSANNKAPLGEFTFVLVASHTKAKKTTTSVIPGIVLLLKAPLTVTLDVGDGKLKPGGPLKVKAAIARNPALAGEAVLSFANLPKGVTAAAAKVAANANDVEILLSAAQDAQVGSVKNLTVQADITVGKVKHSAKSAAVVLNVE